MHQTGSSNSYVYGLDIGTINPFPSKTKQNYNLFSY